jgi:hypothetical protein
MAKEREGGRGEYWWRERERFREKEITETENALHIAFALKMAQAKATTWL